MSKRIFLLSFIQQSGGVDWRTKLDSQKGAVLATELKNNGCKLAKWTLQAILAGNDYIKYGFFFIYFFVLVLNSDTFNFYSYS